MKLKVLILFCSLFASITYLFADNDTNVYIEYYSCDFENGQENMQWEYKCVLSNNNKWVINSFDNKDSCLYVSCNKVDTLYNKKAYAIAIAYREIEIGVSDTLQIEFDLNVGGEGTCDYMKVMLVGENFNLFLPYSASNSSGFIDCAYKDNCFLMDNNVCISETNGQKHIKSKMKNNFSCSKAYLVFIWRNDNSDGNMPGAIVDNIVLKGKIKSVEKSICKGEYFTLNNKNIDKSGYYYDTIANASGCDSIVCYNLTVYDTFAVNKADTICSNEDYILPNGTIIKAV